MVDFLKGLSPEQRVAYDEMMTAAVLYPEPTTSTGGIGLFAPTP